jgi:hypothetical protein
MRLRHPSRTFLGIATIAILLCACNGSGSGSASASAGTGTLRVHLTDAPLDLSTVQSVNVTLTGVTVYPQETTNPMSMSTETGPISLTGFPATFDLLTLTGGATALLATGQVPAGTYSRIRLDISDATMVNKDGTNTPLKIDSNKVDVPNQFTVVAGANNDITLDFNAGASVQVNGTGSGGYILRPVVTPVP